MISSISWKHRSQPRNGQVSPSGPRDGRGILLDELGSHTRVPQLQQLCFSLAFCASLFELLAQVMRLAQEEHVWSSSNAVHFG
mmetsp:Transcript_21659/g.28018  ORF Transcript_21659/g.28018 Transcript_21659/m.28018 type:complete len:83 (+) Transcript_21659:42-290(+)